jgi:hypothetical protein
VFAANARIQITVILSGAKDPTRSDGSGTVSCQKRVDTLRQGGQHTGATLRGGAMMTTTRRFSDDERKRIEDGIEHFFAFVQDVLDDPTVLDDMPERATIDLTPRAEKDPDATYAAETRRFAVTVEEGHAPTHRTHTG